MDQREVRYANGRTRPPRLMSQRLLAAALVLILAGVLFTRGDPPWVGVVMLVVGLAMVVAAVVLRFLRH